MQPGRTLALVGGNVLLESGNLTAAGGRIELGSVARVGEVSLSSSGNNFVLGYDSINNFGNISLSNGAFVDVSGEGGGDVQIRGGRLEMTQSSNIWANTLGAENGKQVRVRATEVELSEGSYLRANVTDTGTGTGGDIIIDTGRLLVRDGAAVSATTYGSGMGGSLQITAADSVEVIGTSARDQFIGGLFTDSQGSGDAGNLSIDTGRLLVRDGAQVQSGTFSEGNGGSLQITASDSVELIGTSADGRFFSGLFAPSYGSGNAGDLTINTGRLLVRDGAEVSATTFGSGKGGSLQITASDSVELIGRSVDGQFGSGLFADSQGSGDVGNLSINTGRLLVRDGAAVSAGTRVSGKGGSLQITASDSVEVIGRSVNGQFGSGLFADSQGSGDAGDLTINTRRLLVRDGAQVQSGTFSEGNGGSLQIKATDSVEVIGTSANGQSPSGLVAQSYGSGDAGDLSINTRRLLVRDGAEVSTATRGSGKGGSLQITASDSAEASGRSADGGLSSGLFTDSQGSGDAGDLRIDTGRLLVSNGAQVLTATNQGSGDAGNLSINTGRLLVRNGAQVSTATRGSGKGGSLQITATDSVEVIGRSADGQRGSRLLADSSGSGDAGNLRIDTRRLLVREGAQVSTGTFGSGNGGSLQIKARDSVEVIGTSASGRFPSGLFAQSQGSGNAGDLTIDTGRLLVRRAVISSSNRGEGTAGDINIKVRDTLQANNGTITTLAQQSSGGNINITASNIRLFGNSDITSTVNSGAGGGGNIDIKADSIIAFDDSDILAFARDGRGGNITLDTPVFFGESYTRAPRNTAPATLDRNNRVDINATGNLASGTIALPDTTSIQNSLTELPENRIDTESLLASSCIVRRDRSTTGSFTVTGTGGLPQRPGDVQMSDFPTVDVETLPSDTTSSNTNPNRSWQKGDPIVEPQGVYRLPNGKLVMSRECY